MALVHLKRHTAHTPVENTIYADDVFYCGFITEECQEFENRSRIVEWLSNGFMLSKKVTLLSCVGLIFKRGRYVLIQGHFSLLQSQLAKRFTLCLSSLKLRHLTRNLRATTCILFAYFYALRKNNAQWRSLKIDFTTKFLMAQSTITKFGLKALGTCRFTT